jgi:dTDP-4-dehydrorhamnose reductase
MKILGTGLTGLVGSRIVKLLSNKYEFENLSRASGIDITDKNQILEKIRNSDAQIILHLAAKTDVDECEKDKILGQDGEAWKVNVVGTRNISDACSVANKKLIYMSTDFVFDGTKDVYLEDDIPNPINWYAKTKYEGEKIVKALKTPWIIARIAYPYRANFIKLDFFRTILDRLEKGKSVTAVTDHIFTPTFVDDVACALSVLVDSDSQGIFHIVGSQGLAPFDAANLIANEFGLDKSKINKTTRSEFFKDRAPRPFQLLLKNDKITKLGVRMQTFEQGLREIKRQGII